MPRPLLPALAAIAAACGTLLDVTDDRPLPFLLGEWAYVCTGGGFVPVPCEPVAGPARRWSFTRDSVFRSTVDGEVVDEGRFRIVPLEIEPGTTDLMLEVDGVRTSTVLSMPTVNELVSSRRCPDCSYSEWARVT